MRRAEFGVEGGIVRSLPGSKRSPARSAVRFAVETIICIRPLAPAEDTALVSKALS